MSDSVDASTLTFLMVGCQRCGTTWVDAALRDHPQVHLPRQKQTYFFDRNWVKGSQWYLEHFRGAGHRHRAVGEVATGYCLIDAAPRMAELLPHVQLLMSVRHPVDRAYSNYLSRRREMQWETFEQALESSEDLLTRGRYIEQIERILDHYEREKLLLMFYEDLVADDRAFLRRILEFLGVDADWDSSLFGQAKNAAMFPRVRRTLDAVGLKPVLTAAARGRVGGFMRRMRRRSGGRPYTEIMEAATRRRLIEYFRPWTERLADFAGRDLEQWDR